jgi:hypothetical protein
MDFLSIKKQARDTGWHKLKKKNIFFGVPHLATFIFVIFVYVYVITSIAYIHPI